MKRFIFALSLVVFTGSLLADTADAVLARLDKSAPGFHGMMADVEMENFTAVLNDTSKEKGTLKMQKLGAKDVRAVIEFPGERILSFSGNRIRIYYPNLNTYQDVDLGKSGNLLNQYLLLGFGSSGTELARNYTVTLSGSDVVNGQPASKLKLVPKDPEVLKRLKVIEVWVPEMGAYPVRQKFYDAATDNTRTVTYSNLKENPDFGGSKLEFKLPAGAKQQKQ